MPDTDVKYFTPSEAKRTLPLVRKIVRDILDNAFQIRTIIDSLTENHEYNDEVKRLSDEVNHYLKELQEIGCSYKDWNFSVGLVDFPSVIEGEEVLLCWRSDEQDILYYHGIDEGYAGRKLIPEEYL
jgi:hypothetical protein